ncbi:hypothetical protein BaRGS_00025233 [Batillaria attramentaria]|uniref:Secreted protein n=1 Tax=Batillaria attramentaria TaxID=370345 RepID=A0ABD0K8Z7_9CAEN
MFFLSCIFFLFGWSTGVHRRLIVSLVFVSEVSVIASHRGDSQPLDHVPTEKETNTGCDKRTEGIEWEPSEAELQNERELHPL